MCSEANGIDELERRIRCPVYATTSGRYVETGRATTKAKRGSSQATQEVFDDTFVPDYTKVVEAIKPLRKMMKCGIDDDASEETKNIPGLRLLRLRKKREDGKDDCQRFTSKNNNKKDQTEGIQI